MIKSVSAKMGIREKSRARIINAPEDSLQAIQLPKLDLASRLSGTFDYLHFFATTQAELHQHFAKLRTHLKITGMLWISWPKGRKLGTDLSLTKVIEIGYDYGLVESKALSIDNTWSALKFTHPKKGKVYANSYGRLKE